MNHTTGATPTSPMPLHPMAVHWPGDSLRLLSATGAQLDSTFRGQSETLAHWELTVVVRGRQTVVLGEEEVQTTPAEALLLQPGTQRREWSSGEVDLLRMRVHFDWTRQGSALPTKVPDTSGRLHELASWLVAERDANFPTVQDYRQGLLGALVAEYQRLCVVAASRIEEKTRAYMMRHLGETVTLEALASNMGMSRYYFCRVYKDVAGRTPMEYLRALRLERAKDLIRSTALPLKAIAPEVGFRSAQHLCRLLHDRFGVGVRELRGGGLGEAPLQGGRSQRPPQR